MHYTVDNEINPKYLVYDARQHLVSIENICYSEELPTIDIEALLSRAFDVIRHRLEFQNEFQQFANEIINGDFLFSKIEYSFVKITETKLPNLVNTLLLMLNEIKIYLESCRYYKDDYFNYEFGSRDQNGLIYFKRI